ncbi:cytochrome B, partial [Sulfolobus sp. F1]
EFPTIVNGIILIPLGLFVAYMLRRVAAYILGRKPIAAVGSQVGYSWKKRAAFYGIIVIFVVSLFLLGLMWTLPSIGPKATYAGMDLGVILMLWGIGVQLYHYEVYVKE